MHEFVNFCLVGQSDQWNLTNRREEWYQNCLLEMVLEMRA